MAKNDIGSRLTMQIIQMASNTLIQVVKLMEDLFKSSKDPVERAFAEQIGKGNVAYVCVEGKDAKALQGILRREGIESFTKTLNYGKDSDIGEQYKSYVLVSKNDMEKAQKIINKYYLSKERGLTSMKNLKILSDNKTKSFVCKDQEAVQLYIKKAESAKVPIFVTKEKEGYGIYFAEKDLSKIDSIRADVAISMSGITGEHLRKQISWMNQNKKDICALLQDKDNKETLVVVDTKSNDRISVGPKGISINGQVYEQGKKLEHEIKRIITNCENPTIFKKSDLGVMYNDTIKRFEHMSYKDRVDAVIDNQRQNYNRPEPTPEEMEKIKLEREVKEKVESKLSQENEVEVVKDTNPYENEESFWGFKEKEKINYEKLQEMNQNDEKQMNDVYESVMKEAKLNFDESEPKVRGDVNVDVMEKENEIFEMDLHVEKWLEEEGLEHNFEVVERE